MTRVVCFGIAVADRVYDVATLPAGEGKVNASGYRESGGGAAATAAVAIAALGGHAMFHGALGDDAAGDYLQAEMTRCGVDLAGLQRQPGARTPSACGIVDAAGERCLIVDRGTVHPVANTLLLQGTGAVLVDHRFPAAALDLLRSVPSGVPTVLDGEGGAPEDLRMLAKAVTVPVFSQPGLRAASGIGDPVEALWQLASDGLTILGVTHGDAGSIWLIDGTVYRVPAFQVVVRDTTGCGDVFHGTLALALAEGAELLLAVKAASAAAAVKARKGQGWHGLALRGDLQQLYTYKHDQSDMSF